jgi:ketosteroid isomerase-like protein
VTVDETASDGWADVAAQLRELAGRVAVLEDERAIVAVLTSYGFAVDSDDADGAAALYAESTRIYIDAAVVIEGRAGVSAMVRGPEHQAILPGCAHIMGPFVVTVEGDRARATGYATTYDRGPDGPRLWRQSAGAWDLERLAGRWQIVHRRSESLGSAASQDVLRSGLTAR